MIRKGRHPKFDTHDQLAALKCRTPHALSPQTTSDRLELCGQVRGDIFTVVSEISFSRCVSHSRKSVHSSRGILYSVHVHSYIYNPWSIDISAYRLVPSSAMQHEMDHIHSLEAAPLPLLFVRCSDSNRHKNDVIHMCLKNVT